MREITYCLVVVSLLAGLLLGCAPTPAPAPTQPIKIGGIVEYTGFAAGVGPLFEEGIRMRLDEAGWEVADRKIELTMEDCASSADVSLDKAKKLVTVDKVDAIIGPMNSPGAHAIAGYLVPHKIPIVGFWNMEDWETVEYGTAVIPGGLWEWEGVELGRYAAEKLGYKTGSAIMPDIFTGHSYANSVLNGFIEKGGTVLKKIFYPYGTMDFHPMITEAAAANPDFILTFHMDPPTALRYVQQYRAFEAKPAILMIGGENLEPIMAELGDLCLGIVGKTDYTWTIDTDINKQFVEAFVNRTGRKPDAFGVAAHKSTSVLLAAIEKTRGDTSPGKLIEALKEISIDIPQGHIYIRPDLLGMVTCYIVEADKLDGEYAWRVLEQYVNGE